MKIFFALLHWLFFFVKSITSNINGLHKIYRIQFCWCCPKEEFEEKNHWKCTSSDWYWKKHECFVKDKNSWENKNESIIKLTISVFLVALHVQTHLLHCRLTKTNWEITKFLFKSCTPQPTQLPNFSSSFLPYSCFLAQLLPPCRVLLIPLLFRLVYLYVC